MIYSEDFVRGRIYSYLKFNKYMLYVAKIVCAELGMDSEIIKVSLGPKGDFVQVEFKDGDFLFEAAFLWDKNIEGTILNMIGE
jgi:hypothetical protein